jgi:putative inorganic carbon (HCO3(-)) transporter
MTPYLDRARPHLRLLQLAGIVLCLPPLIFPDQLPTWAGPLAILGLVLTFAAGLRLGDSAFVPTPVDLPLLLLLFLLPLNLLISAEPALTLPHLYKVVGGTALFYGIVGLLGEKPWFAWSALGIHLLAAALGLVLLFGTQWTMTKLPWLPFDLTGQVPRLVNPFWKPEGFAGFNPNLAGGTVALLLPVPLGYALFARRIPVRVGALVESVALALLLVFTRSRGALLGFAAAVLVMLVARDRRWSILWALLLVVGVTLAITGRLPLNLDPLSGGLEGGGVRGLEQRVELWSRGLYMLQDFPFTGVGMGMVEKVMEILYPTFLIAPDVDIYHVHNLYLEMGAELGYPGLISTLALFLLLFYLGWRMTNRARGTDLEPLAMGLLGTVVVLAVHGLVEVIPFSPKAYLIIHALFGVTVALALHLSRETSASPSGVGTP